MKPRDVLDTLVEKCKERWYLLLLAGIFLLALKIRLFTVGQHWLQAYDPYYQLRRTSYLVHFGKLPVWDALSYFPPGRPLNTPPLMYYLTAFLYNLFGGSSLMEFSGLSVAFYGASISIPAFFLGKELSDWKAGLLSAVFIGTMPAALRRTMAGFYDTDALVLFFTLLTMYFFARSFKRREWLSYSLTIVSLVLFSLAWTPAWYVGFLALGSAFIYFLVMGIFGKVEWKTAGKEKEIMPSIGERVKKAFNPALKVLVTAAGILLISCLANYLLGMHPFRTILNFTGFVSDPSQLQIVNISVAELQNLNIFGGAWRQLFSRLSTPLIFFLAGPLLLLKKSRKLGSLLLTWTLFTFFFITQGIRFMLIFAPAASISTGVAFSEIERNLKNMGSYATLIVFGFLASVLISMQRPSIGVTLATILSLVILFLNKKEKIHDIAKPVLMGTAILAAIIVVSQGVQIGVSQRRSPMSGDWKGAYEFLKHETPEDSVVGTWWDPGHRINAIAQRRNIADGAHCLNRDCDPGLNMRITHLGKILVTKNEDEAVRLLEKYRGNASEMYWIASQDLIGKYQWPQYFGTGCRGGQECPLYYQMRVKNQKQNSIIYQGGVSLQFKNDTILPVFERQGQKGVFKKLLMYRNGELVTKTFEDAENSIGATLWVHPRYSFVVYIPEFQEKSIFTRMYFKEGKNLDHFKQVFRNSYVKIYKLTKS